MADLTHFIPFKMSLPDDVVTSDPRTGEMTIDLSTMPSAASVAAAQATADAAQVDADAALLATRTVRLTITVSDIVAPADTIQVPVPGDCTLVAMRIAATVQPVTGDLTITAGQNGIGFTGGTATLTTSDSNGVTADAAPIDAVFADGACCELEIGGTNSAVGTAVVILTFLLDA